MDDIRNSTAYSLFIAKLPRSSVRVCQLEISTLDAGFFRHKLVVETSHAMDNRIQSGNRRVRTNRSGILLSKLNDDQIPARHSSLRGFESRRIDIFDAACARGQF